MFQGLVEARPPMSKEFGQPFILSLSKGAAEGFFFKNPITISFPID